MSHNDTLNSQAVDLLNFNDELLHIPGLIQPHGILFVLNEPDLKILQVSNNTVEILGMPTQELINKKLKTLIKPDKIDSINQYLSEDFESGNQIKISIETQDLIRVFDCTIHRSDTFVILEIEPIVSEESLDFRDFHYLIKKTLPKIQRTSTLKEMSQLIVKEVRQITGFDRVIIYQFDAEGAGEVIAEDKLDRIVSYLGLHYPALDIPQQARQLYSLNLLRFIPDVNYKPVEIIPAHNPVNNEPVDLSLSVLRSVSPCHIEYLNNMGVAACVSISLIREKKLWGLIACHHLSPKYISHRVRTACEFLGQIMSLELAAKEDNEDLEYKLRLKSIQSNFVEAISQPDHLEDGLVKDKSKWLDLASAQGVALCANGHFTLIGKTPQESDIQALIEWVEPKIDNNIFYTDSLPKIYPAAETFKNIASGLLALSISKIQRNYIFWFRPEVIQTVNWGGNPNYPVEIAPDGSLGLSPRRSFELWQETVRLKSSPWKRCEIDAVLELRSIIVGIVLRNADKLTKINAQLERSNSELDAFAYIASHDLKEPLRGIHNYSSFLIEDYTDVLDEEGISKLQTLMRLTQRMEALIDSLLHFSRLGRVELSMQKTDLNELVKNVIEVLSISQKATQVDIRIPRPLPVVLCDRVQVSEVFSNLIGNAIKYNDKPHQWVEIGFLDSGEWETHSSRERLKVMEADNDSNWEPSSSPSPTANPQSSNPIVFYVRDNGIGIQEKHMDAIFRIFKRLHPHNRYGGGTGVGLTIAKKIVERHGGQIWVESTYGKGSIFYFTLQR
ncbi:MAG: GAF domain-containing protein [Coleofasciculus sp. Co-bin14]|nr:GAF domain-containing protein [Coleofasciculus sp. Co-bin14]